MAKKKPEVRMVSYGLYTPFDKHSKQLPKVLDFTTEIPARLGVEFGYILEIRKARGESLRYRIEHPSFRDDNGEVVPPFEGESYVRTSDYEFFLGDTIWQPVADKVGPWTLTCWVAGEQVARKRFQIVEDL